MKLTLVEEFDGGSIPLRKRLGILLIGLSGFLLILRGGEYIFSISPTSFINQYGFTYYLTTLIPIMISVIALHEGIHALFFHFFGAKVKLGMRFRTAWGPICYVSARGYLLSRYKIQIVALAPQILSGVLLLLLIYASLPTHFAYAVLVGVAINVAGGCSDFYSTSLLHKYPRNFMVEDTKDGFKVYDE